ncbi:hypothetical protein IWQ60_006501 [Tieghemiomyces parasiticus]|uniref:Uncharacterized protein n=1 Tax=Tieghemiomyces parasiticus TaxID=78921 RepID=A0A9W8DX96_9FUNG|nr:hypothetical protein IWQ60_006501 [Tieghemiomyces parasiticus]
MFSFKKTSKQRKLRQKARDDDGEAAPVDSAPPDAMPEPLAATRTALPTAEEMAAVLAEPASASTTTLTSALDDVQLDPTPSHGAATPPVTIGARRSRGARSTVSRKPVVSIRPPGVDGDAMEPAAYESRDLPSVRLGGRPKTTSRPAQARLVTPVGQTAQDHVPAEGDQNDDLTDGRTDHPPPAFALRKSAASLSFARRKDRKARANDLASTESTIPLLSPASSAGSSYTPEYLEQLKKDSFRAEPTPKPKDTQRSPEELMALINQQIGEGRTPDPELITAVRKHRERQRDITSTPAKPVPKAAPEFISLDSDGSDSELKRIIQQENEETLAAEDDELLLNQGDQDLLIGHNSIMNSREKQRQERRQAVNEIESEVLDDQDDEVRRWEMDQIRKGGAQEALGAFKHDTESLLHKVNSAIRVTPVPTLKDLRSNWAARLARLQDVQTRNRAELDRVEKEITLATEAAQAAEVEKHRLRQRHDHYVELLKAREACEDDAGSRDNRTGGGGDGTTLVEP